MNRIKRLVIECKCGRKLFDEINVALSGENLLVLVPPCECAAQQSVQPTGGTVAPANIEQRPEVDSEGENNQRPATSG